MRTHKHTCMHEHMLRLLKSFAGHITSRPVASCTISPDLKTIISAGQVVIMALIALTVVMMLIMIVIMGNLPVLISAGCM